MMELLAGYQAFSEKVDNSGIHPCMRRATMVSINKVSAPQAMVASSDKRALATSRSEGAGSDVYIPSARVAADRGAGLVTAHPGWGPRFEALRNYVLSVLQEQGVEVETLAKSQAEASVMIADDGYWGSVQTADRIFEFAIAQVGDDMSRLEKVRAAIDKGYAQALQAMGGWLPEISEQTIARVHERLDAWAQERVSAESPA